MHFDRVSGSGKSRSVPCFSTWYLRPLAVVTISALVCGALLLLLLLQPTRQKAAANIIESFFIILSKLFLLIAVRGQLPRCASQRQANSG